MSYELFVSQCEEAEGAFPKLKRKQIDNLCVLSGELDLIDRTGRLWETYQVDIHYATGFPYCFPSLFETGGKIPRIGDWHIYEDTFACCVKVKPAEVIRCLAGITITEYINEEALPYLFNQTHRRLEGYYVNGEYGHGAAGVYQFYAEELQTKNDINKTLKLMHSIATNSGFVRTSSCFCGSGNKFRNCHKKAFHKLKQIGEDNLFKDIYDISKSAGIFK